MLVNEGSGTTSTTRSIDEFRAGITACLRSWSALRTAVASGWGGLESYAKADCLRDSLFQHFDFQSCPIKSLTLEDLEDNLVFYMEEEFSTVLEDQSEQQVANAIWRMYEECFRGDATFALQMIAIAENAVQVSTTYPSQLCSTEHDDDDDVNNNASNDDGDLEIVDEDDHDVMETEPVHENIDLHSLSSQICHVFTQDSGSRVTMNAQEYASQSLFGPVENRRSSRKDEPPVRQLGEPVQPEPQTELDLDGFAPVPTKSRKSSTLR